LEALGFIDDVAFAKAWVDNRHLLKPTSHRKLQLELRAKRVADSVIQQVLVDDETTDSDELTAMIARKRRQSRYQDKDKLMQYLARQGFSYEDIKQALAAIEMAD
jgi:regulatory protein